MRKAATANTVARTSIMLECAEAVGYIERCKQVCCCLCSKPCIVVHIIILQANTAYKDV